MRPGLTRGAKSLAALTALVILPSGLFAQDTGAAAFAARDYALAEQLWAQEAAKGSAEAMLGMGVLADSGKRRDANPQAAFGWYLTAARMGLAEGQMNVALSYDAGLGQERDLEQALLWYTRAALRGHRDAQHNLALIYASGDNSNIDQATYWLDLAGINRDLPATNVVAELAAPDIVFGDVTAEGIEIVWRASATAHSVYQIEILDMTQGDGNYQAPLFTTDTSGSGLLLADVTLTDNAIWRVVNLAANGSDYQASPWQGAAEEVLPKGRITFVVDNAVAGMAETAAIFAQDLRAAGYWVRLDLEPQDTSNAGLGTYVSYGFQSDIALADLVARYLPGPADGVGYVQRPASTRPGEIIVHLAARGDAAE